MNWSELPQKNLERVAFDEAIRNLQSKDIVSTRNIKDYDRVTNVLGKFSGLDKINPEVLKNAADRGTVTHLACDALVDGKDAYDIWDIVTKEVKKYCVEKSDDHFQKELKLINNMINSFRGWAYLYGKRFQPKPERFYCDDLMITGECDLIYLDENNELTLVDIKTPVTESKTWMLQASAYDYLARKQGINLKHLVFLQLSRKGEEPKEFRYVENFNLFKHVLETYRYFQHDNEKDLECDFI